MNTKSYFSFLVCIGFVLLPFLSNGQRNLEKGNRLFDMNQYQKAIPYFKADSKNGDKAIKLESTMRLADCYRLLGDFVNAEKIYKQLLKGGGNEAIYNYGLSLKAAAKYAEAKKEFLKYHKLFPDDPRGMMMAKSCDLAQEILDSETYYDVKELTSINTKGVEIAPVMYNKGLVFSSQRPGGVKPFVSLDGGNSEVMLDLYYLNFDGSEEALYNKIYFFPGLNTSLHEGPATFSKNGKEIYFTRTVEVQRSDANELVVVNTLQIFHASLQGDTMWSTPESAFEFNSSTYSVFHPCLAENGKKLFFASDMPGGFGGTDIYVVYKDSTGKWGNPVNLGPDVNTVDNELYPFFDNQGSLYFSSNGHPGLGKLDIFQAKDDPYFGWSHVVNMRMPINSIGDDFGYYEIDNSGRGFLVSDRINGTGLDDIYAFAKKQPVEIILNDLSIQIKNNTAFDGLTYSIKKEGSKRSDDFDSENGYFVFEADTAINYELRVRKDGFTNNKIEFSINITPNGELEVNINPESFDVAISYKKRIINKEDNFEDEYYFDANKTSFFDKIFKKEYTEYNLNALLISDDVKQIKTQTITYFADHYIEDELVAKLEKENVIRLEAQATQNNKLIFSSDFVEEEVVEEEVFIEEYEVESIVEETIVEEEVLAVSEELIEDIIPVEEEKEIISEPELENDLLETNIKGSDLVFEEIKVEEIELNIKEEIKVVVEEMTQEPEQEVIEKVIEEVVETTIIEEEVEEIVLPDIKSSEIVHVEKQEQVVEESVEEVKVVHVDIKGKVTGKEGVVSGVAYEVYQNELVVFKGVTNNRGEFTANLIKGEEYLFSFIKTDYIQRKISFLATENSPLLTVEIEKIEVEKKEEPIVEAPKVKETEVKETEVKEQMVVTTDVVKDTKYVIIVGSFISYERAQKYCLKVQKLGYSAELFGTDKNGLHRVSVSKHDTELEAKEQLEIIRLKIVSDAWILEY
jgi:tetratricopeptide (TPR) repeat protein/cell division septation protein DedD